MADEKYADLPADHARALREAERVAAEKTEEADREHEIQMQRPDLQRKPNEPKASDTDADDEPKAAKSKSGK